MATPLLTPHPSTATKFKGILLAKGSETTNAQSLSGAVSFTTATPGSFAIGNYISGAGIQTGTRVTDIDSNTIYTSKTLTNTLSNGATVTTWNESAIAAGGPDAFELIAGSGISLAASSPATGAPAVTITSSGGGTAAALAADDITVGNAAVNITTSSGNITIDAAANNSDIIFKGTDNTSDITMLTLDGSEEGKAIFNADVTVGDDLTLLSDGAVLGFGADTDVTLTHVHNTGLLLNTTSALRFRDAGLSISSTSDGQLDIDADQHLDLAGPTTSLTATTKAQVTTPQVIFVTADFQVKSTTTSKPVVSITNTHDGTTSGELRFVSNDASNGANDDDLGTISFYGDDGAGNQTLFANVLGEVAADGVADGTEGGRLSLGVATHDGELQYGIILSDGSAEDEIDITIGSGANSVTTIIGDLTVSGTTTTISSTTLSVTDDMITVSKGNDSLANAEGSGIEIECTGATNPTLTYQDTPAGWESNVNLNLASGKSYKINDVAVYAATTIHSNVTSAAGLTTVGVLDGGSITSNFGSINNGSSAITTTGTITGGLIAVDNLSLNGNTISSTSGDIILSPTDVVSISTGKLTYASTNVTSTGAELNLVDGSSAGTVVPSKAAIYSSAGELKATTLNVDAIAIIDVTAADSQTVANAASHVTATYAYATYRTAKFVYQITDGTDFESGEILVNYKGASAPTNSAAIFLTQYAVVSTKTGNAALVTWDAIKTGSNIELKFTNASGDSVDYSYDVVNTLLIK